MSITDSFWIRARRISRTNWKFRNKRKAKKEWRVSKL